MRSLIRRPLYRRWLRLRGHRTFAHVGHDGDDGWAAVSGKGADKMAAALKADGWLEERS